MVYEKDKIDFKILENEVNNEADGKVEEFNKQIEELETKIKKNLKSSEIQIGLL